MSQHPDWIENDSEYQTKIFYTDDPPDPDTDNPTEWVILRRSDGEQMATGWATRPRQAREAVKAALARIRSQSDRP